MEDKSEKKENQIKDEKVRYFVNLEKQPTWKLIFGDVKDPVAWIALPIVVFVIGFIFLILFPIAQVTKLLEWLVRLITGHQRKIYKGLPGSTLLKVTGFLYSKRNQKEVFQ